MKIRNVLLALVGVLLGTQSDARECSEIWREMAFRDSLSVGSRVRATVEKHLAEEDPVKLAECEAEKAKNEAKEKAEAARFAAEMERRSKLPRPKIGMTTAQVRDKTSWGAGEITRMETAKQVKERWTYGDGRYLHFTNGVVTAIQD